MQLHCLGLKPQVILLIVEKEALGMCGGDGMGLDRRFLPHLQDVQNVVKRMRQGSQLHSRDVISVDQLVATLRSEGTDTIMYHHRQVVDGSGTIMQHFRLGICSPFGRAMLKAFPRLVFMDAVYGMTRYGYPLLNLVVRDEYGNGVPLAFCIASTEDAAVIKEFISETAQVGVKMLACFVELVGLAVCDFPSVPVFI
jgi:hypothetical protein